MMFRTTHLIKQNDAPVVRSVRPAWSNLLRSRQRMAQNGGKRPFHYLDSQDHGGQLAG
jgi:hypothetical protein